MTQARKLPRFTRAYRPCVYLLRALVYRRTGCFVQYAFCVRMDVLFGRFSQEWILMENRQVSRKLGGRGPRPTLMLGAFRRFMWWPLFKILSVLEFYVGDFTATPPIAQLLVSKKYFLPK